MMRSDPRPRSVTNGVLTYTWTLLTDPANTLVPTTANTNGVYGKMQVATLPDGTELLIGIARLADGAIAFKLSGPTVTPPPRSLARSRSARTGS